MSGSNVAAGATGEAQAGGEALVQRRADWIDGYHAALLRMSGRFSQARLDLADLHSKASTDVEQTRLGGKLDGVTLCASYVRDAIWSPEQPPFDAASQPAPPSPVVPEGDPKP